MACTSWCNYCAPDEWKLRTAFDCEGCKLIKEFPSTTDLNEITQLGCWECANLSNIPNFPALKVLACRGCIRITSLPELPVLQVLEVDGCTLLTEWREKTDGSNILKRASASNCPLLHFNLALFIRFIGSSRFGGFIYKRLMLRPRNGVSTRLLLAWTLTKKFYISELPIRIKAEVLMNESLYGPGGAKYVELMDLYKDGFEAVLKKRKSF